MFLSAQVVASLDSWSSFTTWSKNVLSADF